MCIYIYVHVYKHVYRKLNKMYSMMRMDIDNNIGLGILRGLDTSSVSKLSLKKFKTQVM